MKLKNEALEKLYGTIVNSTITISPFSESPIDEAFKECDRELTNLQNRNDILEKSNGTLLGANLDLCTKNRDLKDRNNQLQKEIKQLKLDLDALLNRAHCAEDEAEDLKNKCSVREERIKELIDRLEKVSSDRDELQKDRDIWVRNNGEKQAEIAELKKQLDEVISQYQKLTIENKRLQNNVRAGYDQGQTDLWVKLQDVKDMRPNEFDVECECLGDVIDMDLEDFLDVYKKWWEQKETDRMRNWLADFCYGRDCKGCPLESKEYKCGCGYSFRKTDPSDLRIIPDKDIKRYYEKARGCGQYTLKDAKLFATTVEGVNRAITKACEGFCEAVRDANTKITENLRKGCTFEAEVKVDKDLVEKICGVKSEEKKSKPGELVITTRGVTTANYSEATMNAIKEAVRRFEKSLPALDSWESTITGSIKVDDILGNTDNTEHKFEYGDAVRLPWRDYDYMYVGPYEESKTLVRMFDPKMHAMVTSHIGNVKYNGGKIIICDEEDLRKIWKDKK